MRFAIWFEIDTVVCGSGLMSKPPGALSKCRCETQASGFEPSDLGRSLFIKFIFSLCQLFVLSRSVSNYRLLL
jgi:hypothetical protein